MPVSTHLRFFDISDFSAGVFTDNATGKQLVMPTTAAQQMDDCYPQVGTGLRAFFQSTALSVSGLVAPTHEVCTGLFIVSGYARRTGGVGETGTVRYMTTWDAVTAGGTARVYRMDGTNAETTWTVLTNAAGTAPFATGGGQGAYPSAFARFVSTVAGTRDYVLLVQRSGAGIGLYTIEYVFGNVGADLPENDGDVTSIHSATGALIISAERALISGGASATGNRIFYSDPPTSLDFSGAQSLDLQGNQSMNEIRLLAANDPEEVLAGFEGAPWVTISGDIGSATTPVRSMGSGHTVGLYNQQPCRPGHGGGAILFMEEDGAIYETDGSNFTNISPGIAPFGVAATGFTPGQLVNIDGFLLAPNGYVMHEETKAWFKVGDQVPVVQTGEPRDGVTSASAGVSFTLRNRVVSRGSGVRASSYTWRSAAFGDPDARQVEVREVQVLAECYDVSSFAITITDHLGNATTQTAYLVPAGRQVVTMYFAVRGDYCDVTVTPTNTTNSAHEAPLVERVRVGFGKGHAL